MLPAPFDFNVYPASVLALVNLADYLVEFPYRDFPDKVERALIEKRGKTGFTPLQVTASILFQLYKTEQLLKLGALPNAPESGGGTLAHSMNFILCYDLADCSATYLYSILELLHGHGLDLNMPDQDGYTALHVAADAQRTDVMAWLLLHGADSTLKTPLGMSAKDILAKQD